jgi:hypothetical protein
MVCSTPWARPQRRHRRGRIRPRAADGASGPIAAAARRRGRRKARLRAARAACRQQAGGNRLHFVPDGKAKPFEPRQGKREPTQMDPHKQNDAAGKEVEDDLRRQHRGGVDSRAAQRAGGGTGEAVARDPAGVESICLFRIGFLWRSVKPALMPPHMPAQCSPDARPPRNSASGSAKPFISPSSRRRARAPRAGSGRTPCRPRAPAIVLSASPRSSPG